MAFSNISTRKPTVLLSVWDSVELFVMVPALLVLALLNDRELGRDLSMVMVPLVFVDWGLGAFGVGHWPGSDTLRSVSLLVAFGLVGVAALVVLFDTRRFGSEWKSSSICGLMLLLGLAW